MTVRSQRLPLILLKHPVVINLKVTIDKKKFQQGLVQHFKGHIRVKLTGNLQCNSGSGLANIARVLANSQEKVWNGLM